MKASIRLLPTWVCICTIFWSSSAFVAKPWVSIRNNFRSNHQRQLVLPPLQQKRSLSQPNVIRGDKYNKDNSTLPSPKAIAKRLGVIPTKEASAKTWQRAWKLHKRLIPLLHSTDSCKPPDSSLNIACMWWKSLSGNDKSSPVYDNGLSYDLLPSGWRNILRFRKLYPRLHHGNVELRTAYIDSQIKDIVQNLKQNSTKETNNGETIMCQLICMGAGYDTRGVKMLEQNIVDRVVEFDLPEVVHAKERLYGRLRKRRPWLKEMSMPTLIPADFNNIVDVRQKLFHAISTSRDDGLQKTHTQKQEYWHTIFVFEGVMIYLNDGIPSSLLDITSKVLKETKLVGSLVFADRLENVPGGDLNLGQIELQSNGWLLKDWCPKPGLARHMGSAELL